jgi:hypothetical protein
LVSVEDGDTLRVVTAGEGEVRVRVIGLNAPEQGQAGYAEAFDELARVIADAREITLGIFEPETFPLVQETEPDTFRVFAWLYVDGVPLYNPSVFTATNPTGADVGGTVQDLAALLAAERERRGGP